MSRWVVTVKKTGEHPVAIDPQEGDPLDAVTIAFRLMPVAPAEVEWIDVRRFLPRPEASGAVSVGGSPVRRSASGPGSYCG